MAARKKAARKKAARIRGIMNRNQRKQLEKLQQEEQGPPVHRTEAKKPKPKSWTFTGWLR